MTQILKSLKKDRDRQIIARRFGFGMPKKQTLEKIGRDFNITRERVRQIEKAALKKLMAAKINEVEQAEGALRNYLREEGGVCRADRLAAKLGAQAAAERSYVWFLSQLAPTIEAIGEDDRFHAGYGLKPEFTQAKIRELIKDLVAAIKQIGHPVGINQLARQLKSPYEIKTLHNLASLSKELAYFEQKWGLTGWPEVNPRSIRDKTYVVLNKHRKPLHFSDIAEHISKLEVKQRQVTVQAVHNELIKDPRFVLIGRGIYALAEWGYTPGTVADIIVDILKEESPLHKDEIVRRVLGRRQVKTATIVLNLQEKDQFERVAKATYKLKQ